MAYHLHRLNLTGEPLREALKGKAYLATALSQGRATIDHEFIDELSTAFNIAADELSRSPTPEEDREWSFYRSSAANRDVVWENALEFARSNNLSLRATAQRMGIDYADFRKATTGSRPRVLEFEHAKRLTESTSPPADPNSLLPFPPAEETLGR